MITKYDLDCIYFEAEPEASAAFGRLSRDHGEPFAVMAREWILACKQVEWNKEAIKSGLPDRRH